MINGSEATNTRPLRSRFTFCRLVRCSYLVNLLACVCLAATVTFSQTGNTTLGQKSEIVAPGIEHIQFTRGYKSDKEATGPWFINMLRLPGSVAPYFEQRLREKLPTKADRVLNRIRDARGGKLNSSVFGERMRGKGQHWEAQEQLFNVFCKRLGFNEHRVGSDRHERVSTFRRPIAQGSLFA